MKAYAMVGPYQEDFSTDALVKDIKKINVTDFNYNLRNQENFSMRKYVNIELKKGQALYLYGGRQALIDAFAVLAEHKVCVSSPIKGPMALFRAQRTVASKLKAKQLLMLTDVPDPLEGTLKDRVVYSQFEYPHFTTIRELRTVIGQLKIL